MSNDCPKGMPVHPTLTVTGGPHQGQTFVFVGHDTFLVGRSKHAHFRLPEKDLYFSRIHFLVEVNGQRCRIQDMGSHNGTFVNGEQIKAAELHHGDEIRAGHTTMQICFPPPPPVATVTLPPESGSNSSTGSFVEEKLTPLALPAVPGYRLIRELGRGGMGVVYLAERQTDGSMVALKTIVPAVAGSPAQVKRFLREACILFQLRHRNIVAFRDMGEANGMLFFAMEYVDGTNTGRLVKEHGPLSVRLAVRILSQVLSALEYAHKAGFVHRDIKPSNILLSRSGQRPAIKLADFGLARVYQESELSGLSLEGTAGGTIPFMAPEQITHFRQAQPAADQYSAAATLYNLLTGKYLFDFEEAEIPPVALVLQQDQIPLRQRRPDLPEALAQVIHRALSQDPDDRFSNVSAFRQALLPFGR